MLCGIMRRTLRVPDEVFHSTAASRRSVIQTALAEAGAFVEHEELTDFDSAYGYYVSALGRSPAAPNVPA